MFISLFYNKGDTIFIFLYVVRGLDHQVFLEICKYFGFFICPLKVGRIMLRNMSSVLPSVNIWLHTGVATCQISFNFTDIFRLVCPNHDTGNGPCSSLNMCILTQLLNFAFFIPKAIFIVFAVRRITIATVVAPNSCHRDSRHTCGINLPTVKRPFHFGWFCLFVSVLNNICYRQR